MMLTNDCRRSWPLYSSWSAWRLALCLRRTGFIERTMLVPQFVLAEVQHFADSSDRLRRNRGQRGLEILNRLQKESVVPIEITDMDAEGTREVDAKLVKLAKKLRCPIV